MSTFLSHWYLHTECHFIKSTEYALQRHSSFNFFSLSPVMYTHHTWHEIKTLFICKCTISSCFVPRVLLMWYSLHNSRCTVLGVWYAPKPNIFSFFPLQDIQPCLLGHCLPSHISIETELQPMHTVSLGIRAVVVNPILVFNFRPCFHEPDTNFKSWRGLQIFLQIKVV